MQLEQRPRSAVENVERGARPRIDLEQIPGLSRRRGNRRCSARRRPAAATMARAAAASRSAARAAQSRRAAPRRRSGTAPCGDGSAHCALKPSTMRARAVGEHERRDRLAVDPLLPVRAPPRARRGSRHAPPPAAAEPLAQPAVGTARRLAADRRMRDAEACRAPRRRSGSLTARMVSAAVADAGASARARRSMSSRPILEAAPQTTPTAAGPARKASSAATASSRSPGHARGRRRSARCRVRDAPCVSRSPKRSATSGA